MYKPPKGIKYGIVSKEELEDAMLNDPHLIKLIKRRKVVEEKVTDLRADIKVKRLKYKRAFWGLWKAESDLIKAKLRKSEVDSKCKTGWQKRCWEIFKILRFRKFKDGKAKKD